MVCKCCRSSYWMKFNASSLFLSGSPWTVTAHSWHLSPHSSTSIFPSLSPAIFMTLVSCSVPELKDFQWKEFKRDGKGWEKIWSSRNRHETFYSLLPIFILTLLLLFHEEEERFYTTANQSSYPSSSMAPSWPGLDCIPSNAVVSLSTTSCSPFLASMDLIPFKLLS